MDTSLEESPGPAPARQKKAHRGPIPSALGFGAIVVLIKLLSLLPLRWALALGRALGRITFSVLRVRRRVVLENLHHVFGDELSEAELTTIASQAYGHCGMTFIEVARACGSTPNNLDHVTYDSLAVFEALKASGSPAVIVQPHLGNFDFAAYAFATKGYPLHTVMKTIRNQRLQDLIVRTREQHAITVHYKGKETYQVLLDLLRGGGWLGVLPDQRPHRGKGVEVQFLGKPARIYPGPAILHLETGARLILGWDARLADPRRHHVHVHAFEPYAATEDRSADVQAVMQQVADVMEDAIRANPAQYFWFHRLWGKVLEPAPQSPRPDRRPVRV